MDIYVCGLYPLGFIKLIRKDKDQDKYKDQDKDKDKYKDKYKDKTNKKVKNPEKDQNQDRINEILLLIVLFIAGVLPMFTFSVIQRLSVVRCVGINTFPASNWIDIG